MNVVMGSATQAVPPESGAHTIAVAVECHNGDPHTRTECPLQRGDVASTALLSAAS